jgi:hypothetical protein
VFEQAHPKEQKFFGSFFQKRTALPLMLRFDRLVSNPTGDPNRSENALILAFKEQV